MSDLSTRLIKNRMLIKNDFEYGDIVYLKTDVDQLERIVTGFTVGEGNVVRTYELTCGTDATDHYPIEINKDKNVI